VFSGVFMISKIIAKIFGSKNDRTIKKYRGVVGQINRLESEYCNFSDSVLAAKTIEFRSRIEKNESLESILPEAFAVVREAAKRTLQMRHYDVQMMGGIALHNGCVAEMKTGEGKTLSATLPLYLNAIAGKGSHLVTVNDYLAKRDALWMEPVYKKLGMSVAYLHNAMDDHERKSVYASDITYGTNNEFGFDYLRDNMKFYLDEYVQKPLNFAIVDEVDSILIDEARTPLIISGPSEGATNLYKLADDVVRTLVLKDGDFDLDEKGRTALMTEKGTDKVEKVLGVNNIYSPENVLVLHHIQQSLKAHSLFKRDVDYMLSSEKEVLIVDEFTGRALPGRRYSDGLHQALEAKENVEIERENQTLASITLQNYFRLYGKLAGMTGTANTDAMEFHKIYKLDVVMIPTHKPMVRDDEDDVIFLSKKDKYEAVVRDIKFCHKKGQPVLVGTASIESSEHLSRLLRVDGVSHSVLNAKQHGREAEIIKEAGEQSRVTISTSMAGRGTDIKLGNGVEELGGLRVIATERYENRRIDDQLRGRSGRQGDPGSSKFYISLEDDLMRIFGGDQTKHLMEKYGGMEEGESIEHGMVSSLVKNNQEKLERHHFDTRTHLLEYDDVMNQQRTVIYSYRRSVLGGKESLGALIRDIIHDVLSHVFDSHVSGDSYDAVGFGEVVKQISLLAGLEKHEVLKYSLPPQGKAESLFKAVLERLYELYDQERDSLTEDIVCETEKWSALEIIDYGWKTHLQNLDHLKEGIFLRGYGQKQPLYEYKKESFKEFSNMIKMIKWDVAKRVFKIKKTEISDRVIAEIKRQKALETEEIKANAQVASIEEKKQEKKQRKASSKKFFGR
jgi:preprotein translocase subunit SecA